MKVLKFGLIAFVILVMCGSFYQWYASHEDEASYPAPGKLIEIDGVDLHLDCRGQGEVTLVLEAGLGMDSTSWSLIHDPLSKHVRVCAYDRVGMGWSEPITRMSLAPDISTRLKRLLDKAEEKGSHILVGMSAGGVIVRQYYKQYPDNVVGLVLVDSSHEQQKNRLPALDRGFDYLVHICRLLQPIGGVRLSGKLEEMAPTNMSKEWVATWVANQNKSHSCNSIYYAFESFMLEVVDVLPPSSLGNLPLLVLSQGNDPKGDPSNGYTDEMAREQRRIWDELQIELTQLSSNSTRVIAKQSGHVIQYDQPNLVINSILQFVESLPDDLGSGKMKPDSAS